MRALVVLAGCHQPKELRPPGVVLRGCLKEFMCLLCVAGPERVRKVDVGVDQLIADVLLESFLHQLADEPDTKPWKGPAVGAGCRTRAAGRHDQAAHPAREIER